MVTAFYRAISLVLQSSSCEPPNFYTLDSAGHRSFLEGVVARQGGTGVGTGERGGDERAPGSNRRGCRAVRQRRAPGAAAPGRIAFIVRRE